MVFFEMACFSHSACIGCVDFWILNFSTGIDYRELIWLLDDRVTQVGGVWSFAVEVIEAVVLVFAACIIVPLNYGVICYWGNFVYIRHMVLNFLKVVPLLILIQGDILNQTRLEVAFVLYLEPVAFDDVSGCISTWRARGWSLGGRDKMRLSRWCMDLLIWK